MGRRHRLLQLCLLVVSCFFGSAFAQSASKPDATVVRTDNGAVRGTLADGMLSFKGIPYAAPPLGELRWAMPQSAKSWTGTLDATKYKSACPQLSRYGATQSSYDEDCLYLNVTLPQAKSQQPRPVIVWIHGGAFVGGSSSLYPLDFLARTGDAVVVSINYRLGVLGFMAHPAFSDEWNGALALEDQRAALRWVQRNIAAFGGDPANVTIAGESAGAASVCMHIVTPSRASGLFAKAIVQSAGCVTPLKTVAGNSETGLQVAKLVGCTDTVTALSCLRGKTVKELLDAASKAQGSNLLAFAPSVGSRANPTPGAEAMRTGKFVHVPMINGGNRDELRLYVAYDAQSGDKITAGNYSEHVKKIYGDNSAKILAKYPASAYSSPSSAMGTIMSDFRPDVGINNCIFLETAKLASPYVNVYEYVFADRDAPPPTADPGFEMGAVHASDLPYFFPHYSDTNPPNAKAMPAAQQKLAKTMVEYWTSFARSGVPTAVGAPAWEPFRSDDRVMRFEPGKMGYFDAGAQHNCAFWKELYPDILPQ